MKDRGLTLIQEPDTQIQRYCSPGALTRFLQDL